ncbi:hypothetical protein H1C71_035713, partial [Ictidomys tridecemlineatus]
ERMGHFLDLRKAVKRARLARICTVGFSLPSSDDACLRPSQKGLRDDEEEWMMVLCSIRESTKGSSYPNTPSRRLFSYLPPPPRPGNKSEEGRSFHTENPSPLQEAHPRWGRGGTVQQCPRDCMDRVPCMGKGTLRSECSLLGRGPSPSRHVNINK